MTVIVVQGTGDVGSTVAYVLYKAGHSVVMHDTAAPAHSRRGMAFVDALYEGKAELLDVLAKKAKSLDDLSHMIRCRRALPVVSAPLERVLASVHPQVLVDARMRKRERPETQRGLAPLTVGLGPNFESGANVDVAIETAWGDDLGAVLWQGRTRDLSGEPQAIAGHARDRYVYAPVAGVFSTPRQIGDAVVQGHEVARIDDLPIAAPLTGYLRGLTHDGAPVREGTKIIEVDPRDSKAGLTGLGERPRRIAEGVLKAVEASEAG
jgi:xanthine dehydrogenase accessory factor